MASRIKFDASFARNFTAVGKSLVSLKPKVRVWVQTDPVSDVKFDASVARDSAAMGKSAAAGFLFARTAEVGSKTK